MNTQNHEEKNELQTGFPEWDKITGGLEPGLHIIAGRPGAGKSLHMVELICRMGRTIPMGIVTGQMTKDELFKRLACNLGNFSSDLYKKNPKTREEDKMIHDGRQKVHKLNVEYFGKTKIDLIEEHIRLWVRHGMRVILADMLNVFEMPKIWDEAVHIDEFVKHDYILNAFASLAKELNVPIMLYAEATMGESEPTLKDLEYLGDLDGLADSIMFIHRPVAGDNFFANGPKSFN